jgi:hypothetical protein
MFDFVMNEKKLCQCEAICENLKSVWRELKYGKGKDHYYACHIVVAVVVSRPSSSSI